MSRDIEGWPLAIGVVNVSTATLVEDTFSLCGTGLLDRGERTGTGEGEFTGTGLPPISLMYSDCKMRVCTMGENIVALSRRKSSTTSGVRDSSTGSCPFSFFTQFCLKFDNAVK